MNCPECDEPDAIVMATRKRERGRSMRRRRRCKQCGNRFTTYEIVSANDETDPEKRRMRNAINMALKVLERAQ